MSLFDNDDRSRLIEQQIEAVKRALGQSGSGGGRAVTSTIPTPFQQGRTRAPTQGFFTAPSSTDTLFDDDIDAPDQRGEPTELGDVESIFEILAQVMAGTQGTIGGLDPETVAAIRSGIDPSADAEELQTIAQQILDAGGYLEWLEQQDQEGPPEELPTELEEEIDIGADTTLEDEIGVEPDMPIDIPPPTLPPREEDEGEGGGEGASNGGGEGASNGGGTAGQEGQDTDGDIPDYSDIGDPNYGYPDGLPGGGRGGTIYDVPIQDEPGFTVGIGVPVLGSIGSGNGGGGDSGGGQPRGMFDSRFNPYMASIGYTPVAVPKAILPQAPIVSSLFGEYLK